MPKAIITVGLQFGDESKGSSVDFLTRHHNADLNIRYNSGHQCLHNVVLPNGIHHGFKMFGSGTFAGAKTYIDRNVIVEPSVVFEEIKELNKKGIQEPQNRMFINGSCLVTTPYHIYLNRIKEIAYNHGSCGVGIGTTREYWLKHGQDSIFVKDIVSNTKERTNNLLDKLNLIRQRFLLEAQDYINKENYEQLGYLYKLYNTTPRAIINTWQVFTNKFRGRIVHRCPGFETAIFEGGQGVLLDEYYGFHPHTTWSTTTTQHALELCDELNIDVTEVVGICRSYITRHGNGPLPTEISEKQAKMLGMVDDHNKKYRWAGKFRYGLQDLQLLQYATNIIKPDCLFVNCLDQHNGLQRMLNTRTKLNGNSLSPVIEECLLGDFLVGTEQYIVSDIQTEINNICGIKYEGWGPTHKDKRVVRNNKE